MKIALIGSGQRSRTVYKPLLPALKPWLEVVAVCDPVEESCDVMANELGVKAYYDIHELVQDKPMEAALIVTPVPSHYPITKFLASNGIHCHTETTWCSMVSQCRDMIKTARDNRVTIRVAENFFRFPVDRFAQAVRDHGYLGRIGRIFSYADHTGYHNNSRWIAFAQQHPDWVQCINHDMSHPAFYSMPQRRHEVETLKARFFHFPNDMLVNDIGSGHVKGHLGRHPRPGYTEWQGELGTLLFRAPGAHWGNEQGELRKVSSKQFAPAQEEDDRLWGGGVADQITPVVYQKKHSEWESVYADTPEGLIEHINPFRCNCISGKINMNWWYGIPVIDHCVDFVLAVRGMRDSEFTDEDGMMSLMMEIGARESDLNDGKRIKLPLEGDLEADAIEREKQKKQFGVDPFDVEGMLAIGHPRP